MEIGYIWLPFIKCHFTWKHLQVGYLDNTEWAYFTLASDVEVLFLPHTQLKLEPIIWLC